MKKSIARRVEHLRDRGDMEIESAVIYDANGNCVQSRHPQGDVHEVLIVRSLRSLHEVVVKNQSGSKVVEGLSRRW